jgi:glutathione S-transferase
MVRLHGFAQSGNTFKVAFALRAMEQPFENVHVDFMAGVTRSGPWRESLNEMGEIPVLDDGPKRLTQSGAILVYLADKHGRFGGRNADERLEALRWMFFDNHKFTSYFASYRFNKAFGPSAPDPAVMTWLRGRIDNAFGIVDKHLAGRAFMVGEVEGRYPHIAAWLGRLRELPGWGDPYDVLPGEKIAPRW